MVNWSRKLKSIVALLGVCGGSDLLWAQSTTVVSRVTAPRSESRIGNNMDAGTGAFLREDRIASVQGGRNLDFNLYYNSVLGENRGPMGFGWSHNYEAFIVGNPEQTMTVYWDRIQKNSFALVSGSSNTYEGVDEAVLYDKLLRNTNGTWKLTRQDGTIYEFEANGDLRRVGNKVGQYLEMERTFTVLTSIREPIADRTIYLRYTQDGRELLRAVRDDLDRHYFFAYDDAGRMTATFSPTKVDGAHGQAGFQQTIPDNNPQGLTYTINVGPTFSTIGLTEVYLGAITHNRPSDLTITLISPAGTQVVLFDHASVSGPNLKFDQTLLENFAGERPDGPWRVVIVDSQAGETGSLTGFQIVFTPPADAVRYTYGSPISPVTAAANALDGPVNLTAFRGRNGERIHFLVRGSSSTGAVYGTGVYTDDSTLATAAVHARVLRTGELGIVTVTVLPGQNGGYAGSTQNGVTSRTYSSPWHGSYTISRYVPEVSSTGSYLTEAVGEDREPLYVNTYDGTGRVIAQAGGKVNGKIATVFYQNNPGGGLQTVYRDRLGNDTVFVHDQNYRLLAVTDPLGIQTSFQYNAVGDRILLIDPLQRQTSFTYDSNGNLASVRDPSGATTVFTYDSYNNLLTISDAAGKTSQFKYDGRNNLIEARDAAGNRDTKTYNGNSQLIGSLLADGAGMDYGYTAGMPTSAGHPSGSSSDCPSPCRGSTLYDTVGRLTQMASPQGYVTRMEYDLRDNLTKQTDPFGKSITSEYDSRNRLVRRSDRTGNVTTFSYDNNNNLVRQTDSLSQTTVYEYDEGDRLVRVIDPAGNIRGFNYDASGRIIRETNGLGNSFSREYDAAGNEVAVYDGRGLPIRKTVYDSRDLPTSVQDGFGHVYTSAYDALGRLTSFKDPLNRSTGFIYDVLDRIVEVRDPLSRVFKQEYQLDDVISRIIAPRNVTTEFRYDSANRMTAVETSGNQLTTLRYNGSDLVTRETSVSGKVWSYTYDTEGRMSGVARSGGGFSAPQIAYGYDYNGNLDTARTSSTSIINRDYDRLNRLSSFTDLSGNRIGYSYDKAGNLSVLTYPDGRSVNYVYDAANRLVSIRDWANRVTRYSYDANGNITSIVFPNGTRRRMTYDIAGHVTFRQDLDSQGQVIVAYSYSYDASGQITAEVSGTAAQAYTAGSVSMTYDNDNRLLTFNGQPVSFDKDGNMTAGPLGSSSSSFQYDFNNNLIRAGNIAYTYDLEDRLTAFSVNGATTYLVNNPGAGFSQILQKTPPNGAVTRYVWGVGLAYEETGNEIRVNHYDYRGSTVAFTGNGGAVIGRVQYGPFGEIAARTGDTDSLFLFGGLFGVLTDPQGLSYMRFRWYSPDIKRLINQDPHFGDIQVPGTLNRFAYAGNNPIIRSDPGGECWVCLGAAIGAAVSVGAKAVTDFADDGKINDPWEEYAGAAIGGAIQGAIITACPTCGAFAGGAGAAGEYLATQGLKGEKVDPVDLAFTTAFGALAGKSGTKGGSKGLTRPSNYRFATNGVGTLVKRQAAHQLRQAASGVIRTVILNELAERSGLKEKAKEAGKALLGNVSSELSRLISGPVPTSVEIVGKPLIVESSRQEVNRNRKGIYGEYIHYQIWLDALLFAGRPVPNNPNHVLTSF